MQSEYLHLYVLDLAISLFVTLLLPPPSLHMWPERSASRDAAAKQNFAWHLVFLMKGFIGRFKGDILIYSVALVISKSMMYFLVSGGCGKVDGKALVILEPTSFSYLDVYAGNVGELDAEWESLFALASTLNQTQQRNLTTIEDYNRCVYAMTFLCNL